MAVIAVMAWLTLICPSCAMGNASVVLSTVAVVEFEPVAEADSPRVLASLAEGRASLPLNLPNCCIAGSQEILRGGGDESSLSQQKNWRLYIGEAGETLLQTWRVDSVEILGKNNDYVFRVISSGDSVDGPFELIYLGVDESKNTRVSQFLNSPDSLGSVTVSELLNDDSFALKELSTELSTGSHRVEFSADFDSELFPSRRITGGVFEVNPLYGNAVVSFALRYLEGGQEWQITGAREYDSDDGRTTPTSARIASALGDNEPHIKTEATFEYLEETLASELFRVAGYGFSEPGFGGVQSGVAIVFWAINGVLALVIVAYLVIRRQKT
ncbi:MAG: hypothetical protein ABJZ55_13070 [Fuerstiella sp.]